MWEHIYWCIPINGNTYIGVSQYVGTHIGVSEYVGTHILVQYMSNTHVVCSHWQAYVGPICGNTYIGVHMQCVVTDRHT